MSTQTDTETVTPIGECPTDDPYDAEYGGWTPDHLRHLVEAALGIHAAVWPDGEVDGEGDPSDIILKRLAMAETQVQNLRALAVEVSAPHRAAWIGDRGRELLDDLDDFLVIEKPARA